MLPSFYPSIFAKISRKCKEEGEKNQKKIPTANSMLESKY